jgi:hypothetical protein
MERLIMECNPNRKKKAPFSASSAPMRLKHRIFAALPPLMLLAERL